MAGRAADSSAHRALRRRETERAGQSDSESGLRSLHFAAAFSEDVPLVHEPVLLSRSLLPRFEHHSDPSCDARLRNLEAIPGLGFRLEFSGSEYPAVRIHWALFRILYV